MIDSFLTRAEAASYLSGLGFPVAKATLQKYASIGGGPIYRRFGNRTLYQVADLEAWAKDKLGPRKSATFADSNSLKVSPLRMTAGRP